ncbi:DEAD/DEAH box helicase [Taibaiella sp. KBW10]|uniref:DEAD/DEAH box helicase n=1 Tax=Taibaiella sp. KBW10 TaxID=2153357 RepID=UPI000F5B851A|nr:DEAD/DEAH box helicase [Taibaiella sp. KBW10]RQO30881.1 DEAD/DEAH box helicase [Taibaiella sp. KBW10]
MTTFQDLALIKPILLALDKLGYQNPTPIQEQAIPHILKQQDLLGCAQTGTGKTAAFAIPILQLLDAKGPAKQRPNIKALIVTPTRELAIQIDESFSEYGEFLHLKHAVIFGGVNQHAQVQQIRQGIDILTATPGRLLDLIGQKLISLKDIELFVLDEADRMLDMGFIHDVKKIIQLLPHKRQSLFFSATMPKAIQALADTILSKPVKVSVTPESTTAETIQQSLYYVDRSSKYQLLSDLIANEIKDSVLVFTRTKHGADKLVKILNKRELSAMAIHGNKSQNARQNALERFKSKEIQVLVATDLAARGIDIDLLKYVINYEIPNIPESYVHRIGRGGRAGSEGIAISFCDIDEMAYIKDIEKIIGMKIPVVENHNYPMKQLEKKDTKAAAPDRRQSTQPKRNNGMAKAARTKK